MSIIHLEIEKRGSVEKFVLSESKDDPTVVAEYDLCRFFCHDTDQDINLHIGNLRLTSKIYFDRSIFFLEEKKDIELNFSRIFLNSIGLVTIQVWKTGSLRNTFYVNVESTKVSLEEMDSWINSIQEIFPLSNIGFDHSPMSNLRVNFFNRNGFFSISSFANEFHRFLLLEIKKIERPGFLKRKYSSKSTIGFGHGIDFSRHERWLDGRIKWNKAKYTQDSLAARNFEAFEPINHPTSEVTSNYNTDMNQIFLSRLLNLEKYVQRFLKKSQINEKTLEVRNIQFQIKKNKINLINIIKDKLQLCAELLVNIINRLQALGVQMSEKEIDRELNRQ